MFVIRMYFRFTYIIGTTCNRRGLARVQTELSKLDLYAEINTLHI